MTTQLEASAYNPTLLAVVELKGETALSIWLYNAEPTFYFIIIGTIYQNTEYKIISSNI